MMRNKTFFGGEAGVSEGLMYEMFSKPWHCQEDGAGFDANLT